MTETVEQARRALFEAWICKCGRAVGFGTYIKNGVIKYSDPSTDIAWAAFNAALDAVEIELPAIAFDDDMNKSTWIGIKSAISECRSAIQSLNLGLRIK